MICIVDLLSVMADAVAGSELGAQRSRFYCHQCNREVVPELPDVLCPHCHTGFVEKLEDQEAGLGSQPNYTGVSGHPADILTRVILENLGRNESDSFRHSQQHRSAEDAPPFFHTQYRSRSDMPGFQVLYGFCYNLIIII